MLLEVSLVHRDLPKSMKYTIGENLQEETLAMIIDIYKANSRIDKISAIQSAREHMEITSKNTVNKQDKLLVDLFKAYFSALRNKRNTINALKFH